MADELKTPRSKNVLGYQTPLDEWDQPYSYPPVDSPLIQGTWLGWAAMVFLVFGFPIWLMFCPLIFVPFGLALAGCIRCKGRCLPGWIALVLSGIFICGFALVYLYL